MEAGTTASFSPNRLDLASLFEKMKITGDAGLSTSEQDDEMLLQEFDGSLKGNDGRWLPFISDKIESEEDDCMDCLVTATLNRLESGVLPTVPTTSLLGNPSPPGIGHGLTRHRIDPRCQMKYGGDTRVVTPPSTMKTPAFGETMETVATTFADVILSGSKTELSTRATAGDEAAVEVQLQELKEEMAIGEDGIPRYRQSKGVQSLGRPMHNDARATLALASIGVANAEVQPPDKTHKKVEATSNDVIPTCEGFDHRIEQKKGEAAGSVVTSYAIALPPATEEQIRDEFPSLHVANRVANREAERRLASPPAHHGTRQTYAKVAATSTGSPAANQVPTGKFFALGSNSDDLSLSHGHIGAETADAGLKKRPHSNQEQNRYQQELRKPQTRGSLDDLKVDVDQLIESLLGPAYRLQRLCPSSAKCTDSVFIPRKEHKPDEAQNCSCPSTSTFSPGSAPCVEKNHASREKRESILRPQVTSVSSENTATLTKSCKTGKPVYSTPDRERPRSESIVRSNLRARTNSRPTKLGTNDVCILLDHSNAAMGKFLTPLRGNLETFWGLVSSFYPSKKLQMSLVTPTQTIDFTPERSAFFSDADTAFLVKKLDQAVNTVTVVAGLEKALSKVHSLSWSNESSRYLFVFTNLSEWDHEDSSLELELRGKLRAAIKRVPLSTEIVMGCWLQDNSLLKSSLLSTGRPSNSFGLLQVRSMSNFIVRDEARIASFCDMLVVPRTTTRVSISESIEHQPKKRNFSHADSRPVTSKAMIFQVRPFASMQVIKDCLSTNATGPGSATKACWINRQTKPIHMTNDVILSHGHLGWKNGVWRERVILLSFKLDKVNQNKGSKSLAHYERLVFVSSLARFLAMEYNKNHRPEHCAKIKFQVGYAITELGPGDKTQSFYAEKYMPEFTRYCDTSGKWNENMCTVDESLLRFSQTCFKLSGGDFMLAGLVGKRIDDTYWLTVPALLSHTFSDPILVDCTKEYMVAYRKQTKELLVKFCKDVKKRNTEGVAKDAKPKLSFRLW